MKDCEQHFGRCEAHVLNLIDHPNNPVDLHSVGFGERPQPTVTREQDAVLATFGKGECERVVYRELRVLANDRSGTKDAVRR